MKWICLIIGILLITSCIPAEKRCSVDSDCVGNACCHSNDAVNKKFAPECGGGIIICTEECVPGTTDCGQAEVKCVSKHCVLVKK